jgi:hypothetical protein
MKSMTLQMQKPDPSFLDNFNDFPNEKTKPHIFPDPETKENK